MVWHFLQTGSASAQKNMERDRRLLEAVIEGRRGPTWRFYSWTQPAFSFGCSQTIESLVNVEACRRAGVELVTRPTGGGLVIHGWDVTYTVAVSLDAGLLPRDLIASYRCIHAWIARALRACGVPVELAPERRLRSVPSLCLERIAPYDLLLEGRKIAGGAQRRKRNALLHQGYIALDPPPPGILRLARAPIPPAAINSLDRQVTRQQLLEAIRRVVG